MFERCFRPLATIALLAPLALAQEGGAPAKPAPPPAHPDGTTATPVLVGKIQTSTLYVPVTGLTAENAEKVRTAVAAVSTTSYHCAHCKKVDVEAGTCCGKDREATTGTALANVKADSKTGKVSFTVAADRAIRLSDVEKALLAENVSVAADKLTIDSNATVLVAGVSDAAAGETIRKALTDAKLAELADVDLSAGNKQARLTIRKTGMTAATETRLKEAITKANPSFTVADVVWYAPPKT